MEQASRERARGGRGSRRGRDGGRGGREGPNPETVAAVERRRRARVAGKPIGYDPLAVQMASSPRGGRERPGGRRAVARRGARPLRAPGPTRTCRPSCRRRWAAFGTARRHDRRRADDIEAARQPRQPLRRAQVQDGAAREQSLRQQGRLGRGRARIMLVSASSSPRATATPCCSSATPTARAHSCAARSRRRGGCSARRGRARSAAARISKRARYKQHE